MPFPLSDHGAVWDPDNNRVIIWGGQQAANEFLDTLSAWTLVP